LLFTKCRSKDLEEHYDRRYIVGYIDKRAKLDMGDHWAAQGPTTLVRFDDAVPLSKVSDSPRYVRVKNFSEDTTQRIVSQLDQGQNVFEDCLEEVQGFKERDGPGDVPPPSDSGC
jgi:hypothetical protein